MYFETPVLYCDNRLLRDQRERPWACWTGIDAWFLSMSKQDRLVLCFSTEPVEGAISSFRSSLSHMTVELLDLFMEKHVLQYTPIWWWVEIVQ